MSAVPQFFLPLAGIAVYKSSLVPLQREVDDEFGVQRIEKIAYVTIGSAIHVHPDRWDDFIAAIEKSGHATVPR